jgi:GntR family transcriptional regulator / MocR family aminotransferase
MDPDFEFPLELPPPDSRNLPRELHAQLRSSILDGRLQPGLRLPATRAFAETYGVSRNTAVAVYDLLLSEGYLVTRRKAGTYVADVLPQAPARAIALQHASGGDPRLNAYWRNATMAPYTPMPALAPYDFQFGVPEKRFFSLRSLAAPFGARTAGVVQSACDLYRCTGARRVA